jgi:uncharacterized delta-60 repeat protein
MWFRSTRLHRRDSSARPRHFRPQVDVLEDRCLLSNGGALDPTFGNGAGYVSLPTGNAHAVLIQPWDNKIVVADNYTKGSNNLMGLVRYNADGSLDSTFGSGGVMNSQVSGGAYAAALYPHAGTANDGKIVAIGGSSLARFNPNGSLDTTFGKRGVVTLTFSANNGNNAGAVIIQPNGQIVVEGGDELARYNANGTLDTGFGSGGTATVPQMAFAGDFALQADGKFVVGGSSGSSNDWVLDRFNSNGTLDTTFNSAGPVPGTVTITFTAPANLLLGVAIYPSTGPDAADSDKIVAVGTVDGPPTVGPEPALVRYYADGNAAGTPDTNFGQSGQVVVPMAPGGGTQIRAVGLQTDGKIVAAGSSLYQGVSGTALSVYRWNRDGSLDTSWGNSGGVLPTNGGVVQTKTGGGDIGRALAIQADGRIVAVGYSSSPSVVARYLTGPEIGTFTASASTVTAGDTLALTASNITDGDPSSANPSQYATVTQVAFYAVDTSGNQTLLGTGTLSNGTWTLNYTVGPPLAPGSYTLFAQATDSDGIIGDSAFLPLIVE